MEQEVQQTIAQLNAHLGHLPYSLALVDPSTLNLLKKNARYMTQPMFKNLVDNVRRDGSLTSFPLCAREKDGTLTVLSGNHRVQAAVAAGIQEIIALVINRELSKEERVSIQLSHNAIEGRDDPVILKELWQEILDIDLKIYAGLSTDTIKDLEKLSFTPISEIRLDYKQIALTFLPEEEAELLNVLTEVELLFHADSNYVLSRTHYDDVFSLLTKVKRDCHIINNPTAFMKIIEMATLYLAEHPPDTKK
jgi:hypothetical protein